MHIRKFNVKRDIPIGNISASNPDVLPNGSSKGASVEVDIPQAAEDLKHTNCQRTYLRDWETVSAPFIMKNMRDLT